MKNCGNCTTEPQTAAGPAIALLNYFVQREKASTMGALDPDDLLDEMLVEARASRRRFREVATPVVRNVRRRAAAGLLAQDYQEVVRRLANRRSVTLVELLDEALNQGDVAEIIKRSGAPSSLIKQVRDIVRRHDTYLGVKDTKLSLITPQGNGSVISRPLVNDNTAGSPGAVRLRQIATTWATHGRGFATPAFAVSKKLADGDAGWTDGLASGLVAVAWLLDRDVRNLEDLHSLPVIEGNDAGVVTTVIFIAGIIFGLISSCVDDPTLRSFFSALGIILTAGALLGAYAAGIPVTVSRTPDGISIIAHP